MDQGLNGSYGPITFMDVLTGEGREAIRVYSSFNSCTEANVPQPLTVGETDFYVQHYVFPVQFILGVAGNCINLLVLLSTGMKNQANILLSAMAFADLAFLICLLPFSLASFELIYNSLIISYLFHRYKTHFVAFANMFSMCASWLVLAVSIERFSGVRRPMTRLQLRERRLYVLIALIFILAFITTFWHHVEYDVTIFARCNAVKPFFKLATTKPDTSAAAKLYMRYARLIQTIVGVAVPVLAVAFLNASLIYYLRRREILPRIVSEKRPEFRFVDIGAFQRQERKVTATVLTIVSCFTITHLPTLGPFIWEHINSYGSSGQNLPYSVITLLNTLLVSGKVLNFVLFCLSSAHFRHRTIVILSTRCQKSSNRKKYSSMATQSTVNNVKLSNASSLHHSVLLHHNDSVETPLQSNYQRSSPNSSSGTQRSQRVHLQLTGPNMSQNYLLREDSLEMPCSSTATNSASNSARSNEDKKSRDSRRRIFGMFNNNKERTTTI